MVRLALPNTPYVEPATGKAVEGRMQVYLHGTNTHAPLYVRPAAEYIEAANPQLIHAGLPYATLFTPLGVFDVVIEKYIGPEGEMSVYSPDSDFEQVGDYETGIDFDIESMARNTVDTVDDLRDVSPDLKMVTVKWYSEPGDCPPRTYVWDADSQNTEDGGYVIGSDVSDSGKWILMWDDEVLPCSVYGVKPGTESNTPLLLDYPAQVGSFLMATAPCVRFIRGTYTSGSAYATTKELLFDSGVKFTSATFSCPKARMLGVMSDYVADFTFTAVDAVAHSSWFRTAQAFFKCGAPELVQDSTNHFSSTAINTTFTISKARISGSPVTLTGSGWYMALDGCDIAPRSLSTSWFLKFLNSTFREDWFGSGSFDFVNNTVVHTTDQNSIRLANFRNVGNYIKCIEADGQTDVDLSGRHVGTISTSVLRTFRNVSCDTLNVTATGANVEFHNVSCQNVNISGWNLTVHDSTVKFWTEPTLNGLYCYDSDVASQYAVTGMTMSCTFENCRVGVGFSRGSDNTTRDGALTFRECTFYTNEAISSKNISMYGCVTDNANIKVYPYHDGSNYRIFARFIGNTFVNTNAVEFTKSAQDDCYECIADWTIVDNSFTGNDDGIKCRYWSNRTGSYFDKVFIMPDNRSSILYGGNSGKCPAENMRGAGIAAGDTPLRTVDIGSGHNLYAYNRKKRCCPKFSVSDTATATQKLYQMAAANNDTHAVIVDNQNSQNMRSLNGLYYWAYDDVWNDRDGDLFQLGLCIWVTQLDSHWGVSVL